MPDTDQDFRYTSPAGETIEGYQITEASRFQDKLWPDWLTSRDFLEINGQQWIVINGEEVLIPELAWIVKHPDGRRDIVDAFAFDSYVKVVPNPAPVQLAVVEELDIGPDGLMPAIDDEALLLEVKGVFEMLKMGSHDEALKALRAALSSRANWCSCSPGQCEELEPWGCREKSPLVN